MVGKNDSSNNPLRFFENFFPEEFNKMYNEFRHFDKKPDEVELKMINQHLAETDKQNLALLRSIEDLNNLLEPDGLILPPSKYKVLEYNNEEDSMIIEECSYIYLPEEDTYCISNKKQYTRVFLEELQTLLYSELEKTIRLTIDALLEKDNKQAFIHNLLLNAVYVINDKISIIDKPKYIADCQFFLKSYVQEIGTRYSDYISREKSPYLQYLPLKNPKKNYALNMIPAKFGRLEFLLAELQKEGFVEDTLLPEDFQKAFSGKELTEPLKIKWIKMYYGKCNYTTALEMIQLLESKKYIAGYSYSQLSLIFVQNDGSPIKESGWKEASSRKKKEKKITSRLTPSDEIKLIIHNF